MLSSRCFLLFVIVFCFLKVNRIRDCLTDVKFQLTKIGKNKINQHKIQYTFEYHAGFFKMCL